MTIEVKSTTDSKEAVVAAMGDLVEKKPVEETPTKDPVTEEPTVGGEPAEPEPEVTEPEDEIDEELETKDDEIQDKAKKKGGWQRKLERKDKKISTLEQETEYWRQQALRAQSEKGPAEKTTEAKPDLSKRPKVDDFPSHDEYVEALTDWKLEQKLSAKDQEQKQNAVKAEYQKRVASHQEKVNKFSETVDDWEDVVSVYTTKGSLTLQEAILSSDVGPQLMYELAKDQKELDRILTLSPIQAAKEIGKIEARFSKTSNSSEIEKKVSKAPAPVSTVRTRSSSTHKSIYDENLSQKEFEKLREEQLKAAR